jgi:hypothetical protein
MTDAITDRGVAHIQRLYKKEELQGLIRSRHPKSSNDEMSK